MENFELYYTLQKMIYENRIKEVLKTGDHPNFIHMCDLVDYILKDDFEKDVKKDIENSRKLYKLCLDDKNKQLTLEDKTKLFDNLEDLDKMEVHLKKWFAINKPK